MLLIIKTTPFLPLAQVSCINYHFLIIFNLIKFIFAHLCSFPQFSNNVNIRIFPFSLFPFFFLFYILHWFFQFATLFMHSRSPKRTYGHPGAKDSSTYQLLVEASFGSCLSYGLLTQDPQIKKYELEIGKIFPLFTCHEYWMKVVSLIRSPQSCTLLKEQNPNRNLFNTGSSPAHIQLEYGDLESKILWNVGSQLLSWIQKAVYLLSNLYNIRMLLLFLDKNFLQ